MVRWAALPVALFGAAGYAGSVIVRRLGLVKSVPGEELAATAGLLLLVAYIIQALIPLDRAFIRGYDAGTKDTVDAVSNVRQPPHWAKLRLSGYPLCFLASVVVLGLSIAALTTAAHLGTADDNRAGPPATRPAVPPTPKVPDSPTPSSTPTPSHTANPTATVTETAQDESAVQPQSTRPSRAPTTGPQSPRATRTVTTQSTPPSTATSTGASTPSASPSGQPEDEGRSPLKRLLRRVLDGVVA